MVVPSALRVIRLKPGRRVILNLISEYLIHHNKKDGSMLIVKTVLCEFAFAACNDS